MLGHVIKSSESENNRARLLVLLFLFSDPFSTWTNTHLFCPHVNAKIYFASPPPLCVGAIRPVATQQIRAEALSILGGGVLTI